MAGLAEVVGRYVDVPIVDPVTAAVKLVESLHRLGLRTSKSRTYAAPIPKPISGWPLRL
jgi:allantoin racemase